MEVTKDYRVCSWKIALSREIMEIRETKQKRHIRELLNRCLWQLQETVPNGEVEAEP
jgi:hypothetical protein